MQVYSGYRTVVNRTASKELARIKSNFYIAFGKPGNARFVHDHGPVEIKMKKPGEIWSETTTENGQVLAESFLGFARKGETWTFHEAPVS